MQGCQQLTEPNGVNRLFIGLTVSLKVLAVGFRSREFGSVRFLPSSVQLKLQLTTVDYRFFGVIFRNIFRSTEIVNGYKSAPSRK